MLAAGRWALSPAFDLNPVPEMDRVPVGKTPISEHQDEPTIAGTLEVAARFGLKSAAAMDILREVFTAVTGWRRLGGKLHFKAAMLDAYTSAFDHELMDEARHLLNASN